MGERMRMIVGVSVVFDQEVSAPVCEPLHVQHDSKTACSATED
jgi:hypothetical protein